MIRLLTILLLSCLSLNAAIPIIFTRPGTNAVVVVPPGTNDYPCPAVAEWHCEDADTPLQDAGSSNLDLTQSGFFGDTAYQVPGVINFGVSPTNDNGFARGDAALMRLTNGSCAIRCWVKMSVVSGSTTWRIANKYSTAASGYELGIVLDGTTRRAQWLIANGSLRIVQSTNGFTTNVWHHVVGTFDDTADEMALYVDGELHGTLSTGGNMVANTVLDFTGMETPFGNIAFYDELALFQCGWTAESVLNDYYRPFAFEDPEDGPLAFMDPDTGEYFTDPELTL